MVGDKRKAATYRTYTANTTRCSVDRVVVTVLSAWEPPQHLTITRCDWSRPAAGRRLHPASTSIKRPCDRWRKRYRRIADFGNVHQPIL